MRQLLGCYKLCIGVKKKDAEEFCEEGKPEEEE
jgi:hypothetical protein